MLTMRSNKIIASSSAGRSVSSNRDTLSSSATHSVAERSAIR